jgi:hypothetical protein
LPRESQKKVPAAEKNLTRTQVTVEQLARFMLEQIVSENRVKRALLVASQG